MSSLNFTSSMANADTLRRDYDTVLGCLSALQTLLKERRNKSVQILQAERGLDYCLDANLFVEIENAVQRFMDSASAMSNDVRRVQQNVQGCAAYISNCKCIATEACQSGGWTEQTESNYYESWERFAYKLHSITLSVSMVPVDICSILGKPNATVCSNSVLNSTFTVSD